MAILSERTWRRHAHPASGWTRMLSTPLLYVPFWNRSWTQGAAVAAWFAANPVLFPEPEDDEAWITRAVYGEELWTERVREQLRAGRWHEMLSDPDTLLSMASALTALPALRSAWQQRLLPTVLWGSATFGLKMLFLDRMVKEYVDARG